MRKIIISPILVMLIAMQLTIPVYASWVNTELGWEYVDGYNLKLSNMFVDGYEIDVTGKWNNKQHSLDYLAREFITDVSKQTFDNSLYSSRIAFTDLDSVKEFSMYLRNVYYLGSIHLNLYFNSVEDDDTYVIAVCLNDDLRKALEQHNAAITKIQEIVLSVKDKSSSDKLFFINSWITNNTFYDESKTRYKVYDLLFTGTSVCSGYAQLFKAMCDACAIDCFYVSGFANNQSHAFNRVNVDGVIKYIDSAWNAQSKSLTWYMLDENQFSKDHSIVTVYE